MPPSNDRFSKISEILKRVVDWTNQGRFEDHDSWMLFGSKNLVKWSSGNEEGEELVESGPPEEEPLHRIMGDVRIYPGRVFDGRRTSLAPAPPQAPIPELQVGRDWRGGKEPIPSEVAECLDAFYALQIVGKLEKIVERAVSLDPHEVNADEIHDNNVRAYFQQAHSCYLYGFDTACAVMCRTILESALKAKVDPDGAVEKNLQKGQFLFPTLIKMSSLPDELKTGAEGVKKCGDSAAHDMARFQRDYQSQGGVAEALAITRRVLADLYPNLPHL